MAIPTLQAKYVFGMNSAISNNIAFQDELTLVYLAGSYIVFYNAEQRLQRFVIGSEKGNPISTFCISPNRRLLAVAEKNEKATINVFDTNSQRRRKTLQCAESQSQECVCLAFSQDGQNLVTQYGHPDWTLVYWQWERSRVLASIKLSKPDVAAPVCQIVLNPKDDSTMCAVGDGTFKLFRYAEGQLRQYQQAKAADLQNFTCGHWCLEGPILVGTDNSKVILFDDAEPRTEVLLSPAKKEMQESVDKSITGEEEEFPAVTSIVSYGKATRIIVACGSRIAHVLERADKSQEKKFSLKKIKEIKLPESSISSISEEEEAVRCLAISPVEETLVATTNFKQIYSLTLATADLGKFGETLQFESAAQQFHSSTITGLDVCIRKPLFVTCSMDKTIRLWNTDTCLLELQRSFQEEVYSVSLHPFGLFLLAGFSDKLRMMNILIDDIRTFREYTVRGCRECRFSNGGHQFAAVHINIIQIYSAITFETIANLKGHNGKVKSIMWSADDHRLVSCGMDGAVYSWDVSCGKRLGENVLKTCNYNALTLTADSINVFAVGSDQTIKEISLKSAQDSHVINNVDAKGATYSSVVLSHGGRMLFTGTMQGNIHCFKTTSQGNMAIPAEWQEHAAHSAQINRMCITYDDQFMLTVSDDSCIILWKVSEKEGRALRRERDIVYSEEILITKSDLEEKVPDFPSLGTLYCHVVSVVGPQFEFKPVIPEPLKNANISELNTRVEELKMENEYQLRLKDMNYQEKYKEMTDKFLQEMEDIRARYKNLEVEKDRDESKYLDNLADLRESHRTEVEKIESRNNQKLMTEYEKYEQLQISMQAMQENYEKQLKDSQQAKEKACEELTEYYEVKLADKSQQLDHAYEDVRAHNKEYEEIIRQTEEDADNEIIDLKNKYERKLHDEKELNLRLKGETGIMRKKFSTLQKEIEDHKIEISKLQTEQSKLQGTIRSLNKDIGSLKREIQERDETIHDKEKRIYDLKKKNQELDKFKFVLDYKIKELKRQIEPREIEVKEMKDQIKEMEDELQKFRKTNTQLEMFVGELKQKLKARDRELSKENQQVRFQKAIIERFKTDLFNCVSHIQDPKGLKDSIKELYQKYITDDKTEIQSAALDGDIQAAHARQRETLQRAISSLRKKLEKDSQIHRQDNVKIMQENIVLITEINDLRLELKMTRTKVRELESQLSNSPLPRPRLTAPD